MLNFLFRRQKEQLKRSLEPSSEAKQANSDWTERPPPALSIHERESSLLEDLHYNYIAGSESLTNEPLSTEEESFIDLIESMVRSPNSLSDAIPRLPDLIPKLLKLLRSDDASWQSVVEVISQDSVLVAGVIKVANSPFYRLNVEAENLEQVVVHLGQKGVREVVMSVAFKPIMQFRGNQTLQQSCKRIWNHSLKSAVASRTIAVHSGENGFDAYLAGLVHNTGMNIILKALSTAPDLSHLPRSNAFKQKIEELSQQLSVKIVEAWHMPQTVVKAVTDQCSWRSGQKLSGTAQTLFLGSAISMKHSLMAEGDLQTQSDPEFKLENLLKDEPGPLAYSELNGFEL
ncbi:MAG: HDOD domain-containing protein [Gammaproteobacteria bacterium]|nr:HDOD domain-containing protein [Gammaproteobacteria bacterium]